MKFNFGVPLFTPAKVTSHIIFYKQRFKRLRKERRKKRVRKLSKTTIYTRQPNRHSTKQATAKQCFAYRARDFPNPPSENLIQILANRRDTTQTHTRLHVSVEAGSATAFALRTVPGWDAFVNSLARLQLHVGAGQGKGNHIGKRYMHYYANKFFPDMYGTLAAVFCCVHAHIELVKFCASLQRFSESIAENCIFRLPTFCFRAAHSGIGWPDYKEEWNGIKLLNGRFKHRDHYNIFRILLKKLP